MRPGRLVRPLLPLVVASGAAAQAPDAGGEAMVKLLGLMAGAPGAVVLSEAEMNAVLQSPIVAPSLAAEAGLSGVRVGLRPGVVDFRGHLDPARLGPLGGAGAAPRPVELTLAVEGDAGVGMVTLRRAVIGGMELPATVIEDALVPMFVAPFQGAGDRMPASGEPFPLPWSLESVEVLDGALSLRSAAR